MPIAIEIDKFQVGIIPGNVWRGQERCKRSPLTILLVLIEALERGAELHKVFLAIACQVHQLLLATLQIRWRRFCRYQLSGGKLTRSQVVLVKPGISLFSQNTRNALAIQVDPLIARAIQACGKVFQAVGIDEMNLLIYKRLAIGKFKRWERFSFITCSIRDIPYITGLGDGGQIGGNGIFAISKVGGAHQAMSSAQFRKKMKHEDTLAKPVRSHFETSAKAGKGVRAA